MSEGRILNIALCVMVREGRILLIRRANEPYRGWLGLPGGKIHFGEPPAQAALREAREETGLSFAGAHVAGCASEIIRATDGTVQAQFTMFTVLLDGAAGEPRGGAEGGLEWVPLEALASRPDIIPTDRLLIGWTLQGENAFPGGSPHFEVEQRGDVYQIRSVTITGGNGDGIRPAERGW